ncbi:hypothetical protein [Floridanema evergladense]|uniref:Novel STAND NTPase 1 domain-containing protein n=1 Tax=Floridaenema evergladense BLCC-F167 TaxID=3153639 RepID=A0ABV4WNJ3_9CYAN
MTSGSPFNPFFAGSMISDPRFFVGRKAELDAITMRMTSSPPVSVNVVGKGRTGRSSLLYHFFQTYEQRVENPQRYVVAYFNLSSPLFHREEGFYLTIARELYNLPKVRSQKVLTKPFHVKNFERHTFSVVLGEWKRQGVLPVLCLDEFEALFHHPQEFNDGFFDNLSFLLNSKTLMLAIASHRKLDYYQHRYKLTSNFFQLADVIKLGNLTEEEARELVSLPVTLGGEAALTLEEQRLARKWGGCHPLLLQLAASLLWEAHQQNLGFGWAKEKFIQKSRGIPRTGFKGKFWIFGN